MENDFQTIISTNSNTFNTFWKNVENNGSCRDKIKDDKMTESVLKPSELNGNSECVQKIVSIL
jgi:hypothetical protein